MWYVWTTSIIFHALVIGFIIFPIVVETSYTIARCASIYRWAKASRKVAGLKPERWKTFRYSVGWFWDFFGSKVTGVRSRYGDWYGIGDWKVHTEEPDD